MLHFFSCVLMIFIAMLLGGCQTDFQRVEALYFSDEYIETVIQSAYVAEQLSNDSQLTLFFSQNYDRLLKKLHVQLDDIVQQPQKSDLSRMTSLTEALSVLINRFPDVLTSSQHDSLLKKIQLVFSSFNNNTQQLIPILVEHRRFREALEALSTLAEQADLTPSLNTLYKSLQAYVYRDIKLNNVKVHDDNIQDLSIVTAENHYKAYQQKPIHLIYEDLNVPKVFRRHAIHHLKTLSSKYLNLQDELDASSVYRIDVSIGVGKKRHLVSSKNIVQDVFLARFDSMAAWVSVPVSYELFTDRTTYTATVDAGVYINNSDTILGHYVFQTLYHDDRHRLGAFVDYPEDVSDVQYSERYKRYKQVRFERKPTVLIEEVIDDAANVLAVRVLNTVDIEPDVYSVLFPLRGLNASL